MGIKTAIASMLIVLASCSFSVAQQGKTAVSGDVNITVAPSKSDLYVGLAQSDKSGGWVVLSVDKRTGIFVVVQPNIADDGKLMWIEARPGNYGVLFFEEGKVQPQIFNLLLGESVPTPPGPDPPPPGPEPEPDPNPDVNIPDDPFDNLGQRAYSWIKETVTSKEGLAKRKGLHEVYWEVVTRLSKTPDQGGFVSVGEAAKWITSERTRVLTESPDKSDEWAVFGNRVGQDFTPRWPMTKAQYSEYCLALANGIGAGVKSPRGNNLYKYFNSFRLSNWEK